MSEQTASKVPRIRFKGFGGEWNTCRLDEAATVERGKFSARPRNDPRYFGGNIPFVQTGDVVSANRLLWRYSQTLNEEGLAVSRAFSKNTILITIAANIGDLAITDFSVACPDSVVAINARDDFDTNFLYDFLGTKKGDLEAAATTAAQANINLKILKPLIVVVPTLDEQTQIGKYFQELDSLIGLHQRKHDKLVTLKKAMLQKMFPQAGATTPEIRFKGFEEAWVERSLHCLAGRYDNLRVPVTAINRIPGNTPYYGANGIQDYVQGHTHEGDYILVAEDGANDLKNYPVQYVNGKVWVNNHSHVLQGKNGLAETLFLKYAFSQINVAMFLVGGGRAKLNAETMMQMELCVPTDVAEQQKIGTYFRTLDELISKHATQLQKLKQLKSACLEKMFV
jgi:type I restriction enzyme, S subunit